MGLSFWQILLVVVIFLLLFGRGKIPALMGDLAAGIKSFKKEMAEGEGEPPASENRSLHTDSDSRSEKIPLSDEKAKV